MPQKKTKFKERIRRNDLKQRHDFASKLRKRMQVGRRAGNQYDRVMGSSRPLQDIVSDITEGTAMPSQEMVLDPRSLTDLLLRPAAEVVQQGEQAQTAKDRRSSSRVPVGKTAAAMPMYSQKDRKMLPIAPMDASDPLALPDGAAYEEEERQRRLATEAAAPAANKNQYRHRGQAYLFWERIGIHPLLVKALREMRFTHPTPVQEEVLPKVFEQAQAVQALKAATGSSLPPAKIIKMVAKAEEDAADEDGDEDAVKPSKSSKKRKRNTEIQDVIVSAETGSGKTLVFALPILQDLLQSLDAASPPATSAEKEATDKKSAATGQKRQRSGDDAEAPSEVPRMDKKAFLALRQGRLMHSLIVSPTRELAIQIHDAMKQLTAFTPDIHIGMVVGGMAEERQQRVLNRHPHILICTPGRLWDLVQKNEGCYLGHSISRRLKYVILDEADKMLQSGRFEELKTLLERIHCEVLPAGFAQEREEGAETGDMAVEAGRWDPVLEKFVPFGKEDQAKGKAAKEVSEAEEEVDEEEEDEKIQPKKSFKSLKKAKSAEKVKKGKKQSKEATEEEEEGEEDAKPSKRARKEKLSAKSKNKTPKRVPVEEEEEFEDEEEEMDFDEEEEEEEEEEVKLDTTMRRKKDEPQPIPMPVGPAQDHRVVTFVTSATLSLQTNYERRDYSAQKSVIRTSNADVLNKVLQQLEIKPSNAQVFTLSQQADVATRINETYLRCPEDSKDLYLYYFLKTYSDDRAVVFVNAISMLRRLVKILEVLGIAVVGLHASMQQRQRLKFIDKFKQGTIRVLVATDVAARGLDIDGLKYVLHYQVPRTTDAYIHRCGRTARCGGTGLSLLLVNAQEHVSFKKLMESLGRSISTMETFAVQPTVVHQLHAHLRMALQIDKLQKEIDKSRAKNQWVSKMSKGAELDTDDMYDDTVDEVNRDKAKAIKVLNRELELLVKKFQGNFGGKGAFRTSATAMGARQAEEKLKERANRQTVNLTGNKRKGVAPPSKFQRAGKANAKK